MALIYGSGQGLSRLPRLWPLLPALLALLLLRPTTTATEAPAPGVVGLSRGFTSQESVRADLRALAPSLPGDQGETRTPTPRPTPDPARDRRKATPPPAANLIQAPVPADEDPGADQDLSELDTRQGATARAVEGSELAGFAEGQGGGYGGAYGSGTIRHTALPDRAPMAFLGVEDLPPPPGQPPAAELWVAQTEVTEGQWQALMRLDLAILTGRPDRPAEHMTWCEALLYANLLSKQENLKPAYDIPRGCHQGALATWDTGANGYRLPTEGEWERMAGLRPGEGSTRRATVFSGERDGAGLYGVAGNAAELVWAEGKPVARHRSCEAESVGTDLWAESAPLPCRQELPQGQRTIGVGLRLVRAAQ